MLMMSICVLGLVICRMISSRSSKFSIAKVLPSVIADVSMIMLSVAGLGYTDSFNSFGSLIPTKMESYFITATLPNLFREIIYPELSNVVQMTHISKIYMLKDAHWTSRII